MIEKHHHLSLRKFWLPVGLIFFSSLALGVGFQLIFNVGEFWKGFSAAAFFFFFVGVGLFLVWRAAGVEKIIGWMMITAFFARIALGIFLAWGLPQFGYDTEVQQAGFVYADPFNRESNAWALAQSGEPLYLAFSEKFEGDQYGGMFALSAFIYRYISPDAFRPVLIVILTAGASALSLPFFISFLKRLFDQKIAILGGWILALYPESILLGSSQMRESFFILFFSILLWTGILLVNRSKIKLVILVSLAAILGLFLLSPRVALPIVGVVFLTMWVIKSSEIENVKVRTGIWAVLLIGVLISAWFVLEWVFDAVHWDTYATLLKSGMGQVLLKNYPDWLTRPLIIVYGILQPVLPAAIVVPAPWIWQSLAIFRAVGWYAMLPLLVYGGVRYWRLEPVRMRRIVLLLAFVVWVWILISSARAGGDQWDNPRYRTIFLPVMAALSAWVLVRVKDTKDRWLWRGLLIEGVAVGSGVYWYLGRYYHIGRGINAMVAMRISFVLCALIIFGGWVIDNFKTKGANK